MGLGANGTYEIGGTINNDSAENVFNSAITYITIDADCKPGNASVANLGEIKSHSSLEFRIPVEGVLSSYRILSVSAWDAVGIPLKVDDNTAGIIREREAEFKKQCLMKHGLTHENVSN